MINPLIMLLMLVSVGAGIALFTTLSIIERGTRRLMFNPLYHNVSEGQIRATSLMLHHLVPFFPPFQGFIMAGCLISLVWQGALEGWSGFGLLRLLLWIGIMFYIVAFRRIGASVRFLKSSFGEIEINALKSELGRVIGSHHLALVAYVLVLVIQILAILVAR